MTGAVAYVNAGQNPPVVRRSAGEFERLGCGGVALGMFERSRYETGHMILEPADLLILYSDGITEAEDPHGRPFDEPGLQHAIEASSQRDLPDLGSAVFQAVKQHVQGPRFADDLTILLLRRLTPAALQSI